MTRNLTKGFTLIELMMVVAVIAIIAVVALPSMQASKRSAVDAKAIGMLRTIVTSQEQYKTRFGVYAPDLFNLSSYAQDANYVLKEFNENYTVNPGEWALQLDPTIPYVSADRSFFVDNTGVIRARGDGPAGSTDTPVD